MNDPTTPVGLLIGYGLAVILISLLGGWLPRLIHIGHTRLQLMISFVGGLMIGIAVFHMLPHSLHGLGSERFGEISWAIILGMMAMFFLLRFFHFHQHTVDEELSGTDAASHAHDHDHHHECSHDHHHEHKHPLNAMSWMGMLFGLGVHTFLDGVALASTIQVEAGHGHASTFGLAGFGVFLAIFLHKPLDAMSLASLMRAQGANPLKISLVNISFACLVPIGAACVVLFGSQGTPFGQSVAGLGLAFSAGVFLCIALSDLLPEMEFHSHHRLPLSIALILGVLVAYAVGFLEPEHLHQVDRTPGSHQHDHDHDHDHSHGHGHDQDSPSVPKADSAMSETESFERLVESVRGGEARELAWSKPLSNRDFDKLRGLTGLEVLELPIAHVDDAAESTMATLTGIRRLRLEKAQVGDKFAMAIGKLTQLETINLPDSQISDDGIRAWQGLTKLILLRVGSPNLTDAAFETIGSMHHLRFLHLINVPITDNGLKSLYGMEQLESFYLDGGSATDEGLAAFLKQLPRLHFHRDQQHLPNDPLTDKHSS